MEKKNIAEFFDRCAPWWDADMIRKEDIIAAILDNCGIRQGMDVLDVACGTGVLFPDYITRNVGSVTGIDISPEMVKIAADKFPQVRVICGDVEETPFDTKFDAVMVYNAFPHFPDPEKLIRTLAQLVKPGGRLSVAHSMSRAQLQQHHSGRASQVSIDLIHEDQLAELFYPWFAVDVVISDDQMYQVAGTRRERALPPRAVTEPEPLQEVLALMRFMVSHNDAHSQEMAGLASRLRETGRERASKKIMDAVAEFDVANARLAAVLQELETE